MAPLLFALVAADPVIGIGTCAAVDAGKVRALVAMELASSGSSGTWDQSMRVTVDCQVQPPRVRLVAPDGTELAARTVDLDSPAVHDRDAANRELSLAIAELVRRGGSDLVIGTPGVVPPPGAPAPRMMADAAQISARTSPAGPPSLPWRLQAGAVFSWEQWTSGQARMGADAGVRLRVAGPLSLELRIGGRRMNPVAQPAGQLRAAGAAASLAAGLEVLPGIRRVTLAIVARVCADRMTYTMTHEPDGNATARSASAIGIVGGPMLSVGLTGPLRAVAEATAGRTLHTVTVNDAGARVVSLEGTEIALAAGLAAQF